MCEHGKQDLNDFVEQGLHWGHLQAAAASCELGPWTTAHSVMPSLLPAAERLARTEKVALGILSWHTRVSAAQMLLAQPLDSAAVQHCCGRTLNKSAHTQDWL